MVNQGRWQIFTYFMLGITDRKSIGNRYNDLSSSTIYKHEKRKWQVSLKKLVGVYMCDWNLQADIVMKMRWVHQEGLTHYSSSLGLNIIILLDYITTQCSLCKFLLEVPLFIILLQWHPLVKVLTTDVFLFLF